MSSTAAVREASQCRNLTGSNSRRTAALTVSALLLLMASFAWAQSTDQTTQAAPQPTAKTSRGQLKRGVDMQPSRVGPPPAASSPAGAHLTYYGGKIVATPNVVIVLYGNGAYLSQVSSTGTPSMASFYTQFLSKTTLTAGTGSLLSQYNVTGQTFTPNGGYSQILTITPSAANNGSTIDDSQIQAELKAQIAAGHLPAPTVDAAGKPNTYYAVFFPPGKTITQGGSSSCVGGGFCAYHGTIAAFSPYNELYYGVHPDMQPGSGCATGCGSSSTFGNYTSVASHELVETMTDAEVGLATVVGAPLAWYDATNGEIGDICNASQGTFAACDGQTYTYQLEFSNAAPNGNACVTVSPSCGTVANDFSISASPTSLALGAGTSGSATISTATTSGSAQTVSLSVSGAPSGVTATLSPTSVTSGSTSTLNVTVGSAVANGTYTLTVKGTAASGSHSTTVSLLVSNNFNISASPSSISLTAGNSATSKISTSLASGSSTQTIALSYSGAPTGVTVSFSPASVTVGGSSTATITSLATTANGSYTITVTGNNGTISHTTPITLAVSGSTSGTGLTNGGFETGNLGGWTSSGAAAAVVNSGCHGGIYCARLGSTAATNGDSTITQTFNAPSNANGISLWYKMSCPDVVTYDWAIVTLQDVTAGTTATLLPRTCATNAWTNVTGPMVAGHKYTLTLTSHDDNYSSDPSYTLYDDVSITTGSSGGGNAILNGGFESGSTSWTTSGASTAIVTSGCHSGTNCARAGSTAATNGDSNWSQTFTAATGNSLLSFWYKVTCPDVVTYDWATATLKDNTLGITATVLAKTCTAAGAWTPVTAAITAGHNYTLTLTSHDDNYSSDPTFVLFDDVQTQ